MRVNKGTLLKIARDTVARYTRADRSLMAAYLHGSLLEEDYLLNGTVDIDLFLIYAGETPVEREITALTGDIHLDIAHHLHRDYRNPRLLRVHPWLGWTLKDCQILYDPQHFLDFTQASVRGQFESPEFVLQRARKQVESARQIWYSLYQEHLQPSPQVVISFLRALENSANAIACLSGAPLTERRFLMRLAARGEAVGWPGIEQGISGLLGAGQVDPQTLRAWIETWQDAYLSVPPESCLPRIHAQRLLYYRRGFEAALDSSKPHTMLWPLLRTWTLAVHAAGSPSEVLTAWHERLEKLGITGDAFAERVAGLDIYLDTVEEILERWAVANGAAGLPGVPAG